MPSILPRFEYDIFVSYRHNDNRSGWVTEFVKNLNEELAATIKEPVSLYFDSNPHDGLLETHDVDDSLKGKLNCFIFIPIISQTYCDANSFAWKHEFLAFKKNLLDTGTELKLKLSNGNVGSRILPVCIHDLDASDKQLFENELGSVLRGIEFIYKAPGVVRPLKPTEEDPKGNLNHTYYQDQINKVARAVKELILAAQHPGQNRVVTTLAKETLVTPPFRTKLALAALFIVVLGLASFSYYYFGGFGKRVADPGNLSIAVLPFENMVNDPEQDYFCNGIAEDILNHLNKIAELKVKSRTSTLKYKESQKSIIEIGQELGVGNVLDGSVRREGDKVRIVVKLIDTKTDTHVWSETYDRELKDILSVQSEIAIKVANALRARLTPTEKENIQRGISDNVIAYDFFLRARSILYLNNEEKSDYDGALLLVSQAIRADPGFSRAYALKGRIWFNLGAFGIHEKTWYDSAMYFASKAIALDPSLPDGYLLSGEVNHLLGKLDEANKAFEKAYIEAPNDPDALAYQGLMLLEEGNEKGADLILKSTISQYSTDDPEYFIQLSDCYRWAGDFSTAEKLLKKVKSMQPELIYPYVRLANFIYREEKEYTKGITELLQAEKLSPSNANILDGLAWLYYLNNDLKMATTYWLRLADLEDTFEDSTQTLPFRHRLGMTYLKLGKANEADPLFREQQKIQTELLTRERGLVWGNSGSTYYDLAVCASYFGEEAKAVQCLDSAWHYRFLYTWGFRNDPMLDNLRDRDDFKKVLQKAIDYDEMRRRGFANALNRMEAGNELKDILK